jgi:hypothetical protein
MDHTHRRLPESRLVGLSDCRRPLLSYCLDSRHWGVVGGVVMVWNIFKRLRELEARIETLESQTAPVLMTVAERRAKKAAYSKQYYATKKLEKKNVSDSIST